MKIQERQIRIHIWESIFLTNFRTRTVVTKVRRGRSEVILALNKLNPRKSIRQILSEMLVTHDTVHILLNYQVAY